MMSAITKRILPAACLVLGAPAVARACAVCLTGAGDDSVTEAFNLSVLFLMAAPYAVVGGIVGCLIYVQRGKAAQTKTEPDGEPAMPLATIQKESATR
ncbi:MAG TPA: hypothetical protein VF353_00605 [Candidatus Binatia bacterium]|jgi:hypothetical protein